MLSAKMLLRLVVVTGVLSLALLILSDLQQTESNSRRAFEKEIQSEILVLIDNKHKANDILKNKIRKSGFFNFSYLSDKHEFQSVFNQEKLIYWGKNIFLPDYQRVKGEFREKYIEQKSGKFLVVKDTLHYKTEVFEIVNLVPLYYAYNIRNQYVSSGPNTRIFGNSVSEINNYGIEKDISVFSKDRNYLFSVNFSPGLKYQAGAMEILVVITIVAFVFLLTIYIWNGLFELHHFVSIRLPSNWHSIWKRNESHIIFFATILYAILLRSLLLIFKLPNSIIYIRYFNPKYYQWDSITPSPGDLLLHIIFLVMVLLAFKKLYRKNSLLDVINKSSNVSFIKTGTVIVVFVISHLALLFLATSVYDIFNSLKFSLDISENLSSQSSVYFTLLHFILSTGFFIGISRTAYELVEKNSIRKAVFQYVTAVLIFLASSYYFIQHLSIAIFLIHIIFFCIVVLLKLPSGKHSFDYAALVFYTLGALSSAAAATFSLARLYPKRDLELKTNFITHQLQENNLLGESLLNEISRQVSSDHYVSSRFRNSMFTVKDIEEKVKRVYLGNYLNKYDIQVKVFDEKGLSLNSDDKRSLQEVRNMFPYRLYRTNYPEIYYYITQQNQILKNYLSNVIINEKGLRKGSVLIDLQVKKFIPNSILPILLVDRKAESFQNPNNYSYALFNKEELTNSFGNFNFRKEIVNKILKDSTLYNTNVQVHSSYFFVSDLGKGRKIIVQSEIMSRWLIISNLSLLFILAELSVFAFFIGNLVLFDFSKFYNSLTFKIQFYTITAFFIPVSLVSTGILTAVITTYNQELQNHFKENATNIAYALSDELENYYYKSRDLDKLNDYVLRSARLYNTDVHIYRKSGQLLLSSSPVLFESGLVSTYVDPLAYYAIRQEKNRLHLQEEQIGSLLFNHVYVQIRSNGTGEELGIISIPFFASGKELSVRITNALKIILTITTLTFMIFIFFSYAASNFITYPLKLITLRIRKTTLESDNRPLEWKSKDELGLLIREYNLMLQKLDQNKRALATSQKEIAWREVAQQVAHEIKNPLTPIKLSLQHLKRLLTDGNKPEPERLGRTISNIISQVETLDSIASSFSLYAKMPSFTISKVDLKRIAEEVTDVYGTGKSVILKVVAPKEVPFVLADEKMLGRIIANLILNALQAIPADRQGEIILRITPGSEHILLEIRDNGSGIPEDVIEKVFEPHFSTKFSGSGIGLFVVKKGIEQMGGNISCHSDSSGTVFRISLKKA